jgi:hypothetical protein
MTDRKLGGETRSKYKQVYYYLPSFLKYPYIPLPLVEGRR